MISNSEFVYAAGQFGFSNTFFLPTDDIPAAYDKLISSPKSILPGAKTLILLIMPYELADGSKCTEGVISNYYKASQRAYKCVKQLANMLIENGSKVVYNANIPLKNAIVKYNIGVERLNTLTYIDGLGSAFHIQNIITDCGFDYSHVNAQFSHADCMKCMQCLEACPTKAISVTGYVDAKRCLRSVSEQKSIREEAEALLGNRLLGCDECQTVCPHNKVLSGQHSFSYPLDRLLKGDMGELPDTIGPNLARKTRMICKACVLAANNKRSDLLPLIRELTHSSDDYIVAAAKRALSRLEECI